MSQARKKRSRTPEEPAPSARTDAPVLPQIIPGGSFPMSSAFYPFFDTDLGRDNLENDLPDADL